MIAFLSPEWIGEVDRLLAGAPDLAVIDGDRPLVVQQHVRGTGHDRVYHLVLDGQGARARAGRADDPDVELVLSYATAAAVARGELSAQAAFQSGALRVIGTVQRLAANRGAVARCDDVLAPLRAMTTYEPSDA